MFSDIASGAREQRSRREGVKEVKGNENNSIFDHLRRDPVNYFQKNRNSRLLEISSEK